MRVRDVDRLRRHGIRPSAQRVAVARHVLHTGSHPDADAVWRQARRSFPMLSRATVYNTLNLLVEKGLLRQLVLQGGSVVYDANVADHHHFIDDSTGAIHDVPWEAVQVSDVHRLAGFEVREYQVVMRGRKHPPAAGHRPAIRRRNRP